MEAQEVLVGLGRESVKGVRRTRSWQPLSTRLGRTICLCMVLLWLLLVLASSCLKGGCARCLLFEGISDIMMSHSKESISVPLLRVHIPTHPRSSFNSLTKKHRAKLCGCCVFCACVSETFGDTQKSKWRGKWRVRRFELLQTKQIRVFLGPKLRATFDVSSPLVYRAPS